MTARAIKERPVIGRYAMVQIDGRVLCLATVIDKVAGTNCAKRVRLQSGEHAGEVRMPGQYELVEFMDCRQ